MGMCLSSEEATPQIYETTLETYDVTLKTDENTDRSTLLKWFETREETDDFFEFMCNHSQQFVVLVIDIILDTSANSQQENAIGGTLFREFRSSPQLWEDLPSSIQEQTKHKLLQGIIDTEGSNKVDLLAHIVGIVATFEEWDELIPHLLDLNTAHYGKLHMFCMIGRWCPDRLEKHSLPVLNEMYNEISRILKDEPTEFTVSLFRAMDAVINNIEDETALIVNVMRVTIVFLLQSYVTNHEELDLIDEDLNINASHSVFNKMDLNIEESYDTAMICFGLLVKVNDSYFSALSSQLRDGLILISNVFLRICAEKIKRNEIEFASDQHEWSEDAWNFAILSNSIFSIFYQIIEQRASVDYFKEYFGAKDGNDLIVNMISNINYDDIDEGIVAQWPHLLQKFAEHYAFYMWNKADLLVPFLQMEHRATTMRDVNILKEKLYHQEWLAVRCFVRHHYSPLYDHLRIPIMEMILKYLSQYLSINITSKDAEDEDIWNDDIQLEYDVIAEQLEVYDLDDIHYNVENQMISKHQRECLIAGYINTVRARDTKVVPKAISAVIYRLYPWMLETFDVYNKDKCKIENENTMITLTKSNVENTVYGRINITPKNKDIHVWKFKVFGGGQFAFGIDESDCKMIDDAFIMPSPDRSHYAYAWYGGKFCLKDNYKPYGATFSGGDEITMVFDANQRTLRFYKNDVNQRILADRIDLTKTYKMAVFLSIAEEDISKGIGNSAVSLISYQCAIKCNDKM